MERAGNEGEGGEGMDWNKGRGGRGRGPLRGKWVEREERRESEGGIGMFRILGRRRIVFCVCENQIR